MRRLAVVLASSCLIAGCGGASAPAADSPSSDPSTVEGDTVLAEPAVAESEPQPTEPQPSEPQPEDPSEERDALDRYPLVIVFYSPGNGTDVEAFARLKAVVEKTAPAPRHDTRRWGKEGEHNECFAPGELDEVAFAEFAERARAAVESSDRVKVSRDAACDGP